MPQHSPVGRLSAVLFLTLSSLALSAHAQSPKRDAPRLEAELAPNQAWISILALRGSSDDARAWIVPLDGGAEREFTDLVGNGAQTLAWNSESQLRLTIQERDSRLVEMRWLDLETDLVVRSTRDREDIRAELRTDPDVWAAVEEKKLSDRRLVRTIQWRSAGRKVEIATQGESQLQVVATPGVVFYSTVVGSTTQVFRCDVGTGARREVARSDASAVQWSASEDGYKLLLTEQGHEQRARIVDAHQGTLLHGPWITSSATWVHGVEGRYVAAVIGTRNVVIDTLRDRNLEIGFESWPWINALRDGRFVVEDDAEVRLYNDAFELERTLFRAPAAEMSSPTR